MRQNLVDRTDNSVLAERGEKETNWKYLRLQKDRWHGEYAVNRVSSSFPKGGTQLLKSK